jgi:hypothetical protein
MQNIPELTWIQKRNLKLNIESKQYPKSKRRIKNVII